jgi:hypothetical protein
MSANRGFTLPRWIAFDRAGEFAEQIPDSPLRYRFLRTVRGAREWPHDSVMMFVWEYAQIYHEPVRTNDGNMYAVKLSNGVYQPMRGNPPRPTQSNPPRPTQGNPPRPTQSNPPRPTQGSGVGATGAGWQPAPVLNNTLGAMLPQGIKQEHIIYGVVGFVVLALLFRN